MQRKKLIDDNLLPVKISVRFVFININTMHKVDKIQENDPVGFAVSTYVTSLRLCNDLKLQVTRKNADLVD